MKDLNGRTFPLLGDVTRSTRVGKQVVGVPNELGVIEFQ